MSEWSRPKVGELHQENGCRQAWGCNCKFPGLCWLFVQGVKWLQYLKGNSLNKREETQVPDIGNTAKARAKGGDRQWNSKTGAEGTWTEHQGCYRLNFLLRLRVDTTGFEVHQPWEPCHPWAEMGVMSRKVGSAFNHQAEGSLLGQTRTFLPSEEMRTLGQDSRWVSSDGLSTTGWANTQTDQ